jgi:CBS domain-containing protein
MMMKCKDIMTSNPTTCATSATAQAAALIMNEENVGVVPVVDGQTKRLVGVVTDRDLCLDVVAEGKNPQAVKIGDLTHDNLVTCRAEDDIELCLERMKSHQIRRMPIVDQQGLCIGIISQGDIALKMKQAEDVHDTVREISKSRGRQAA